MYGGPVGAQAARKPERNISLGDMINNPQFRIHPEDLKDKS
jgi:hypothetical protein